VLTSTVKAYRRSACEHSLCHGTRSRSPGQFISGVAIIKASVYRPIGRYRRSKHIEIAKSLNMACQIAASFISDGERRYFYAKENRI